MNPAVFAALTSFWLVVKVVASFKTYHKKAEKTNIARVEYKKILDTTRFHLRSEPFSKRDFLDKLKMINDFVSDQCMEIPVKVQVKYAKRLTSV